MDFDVLLVVLVLLGLPILIWLVVRSNRRATTDLAAQRVVEHIVLVLLGAYPSASDEQIVQLVRDELLNRLAREPSLFSWASLETVGRVRRTVVRTALGHLAAPEPRRAQTEAKREPEPFDGTCPVCRQKNDDDAWKCCKCGKILPSAWE
jgi:hypothetical protein